MSPRLDPSDYGLSEKNLKEGGFIVKERLVKSNRPIHSDASVRYGSAKRSPIAHDAEPEASSGVDVGMGRQLCASSLNTPGPSDLLALQHTLGNQFVQRLLTGRVEVPG